MSPEITIAFIAAVGGVLTAIIAAYATARQTNKKELDVIKKIVTLNELKVNTLWEIYAEDAIRSAKQIGFVASQSTMRPTKKLQEVIDMELQEQIRQESLAISKYLSSPYDIAIEIWSNHRKTLIRNSKEADVAVAVTWGSIVTIVSNTLASKP